MNNDLPLISIVIPTYNEEKNLPTCLNAIFTQNYPQDKLEIIIVDNGSEDKTIKIIKKYIEQHKNIKLIFNNQEKNGETSKMMGFRITSGEYFIYLDADIEILGNSWCIDLINPHLEIPELCGSFGRFWPKKGDVSIGRYLRYHPLELDPVFQFFCTEIKSTIFTRKEEYDLCCFVFPKIPPLGICLYKKKYLEEVLENEKRFMDIDVPVKLAKAGYNLFAYVEKNKFYHINIKSLKDLVHRRIRNINNIYLPNIEKREYKYFDLASKGDIIKIIFWVIYANLFIPKLIRGVCATFKNSDIACMYEPVVSLILTDAIMWGFLKNKKGRNLILKIFGKK